MPRRLAADSETLTERYGRFSAQPFERGFGTTVGNSLRRALLSSIEGAHLVASGITLPEKGAMILFIALAVIGLIVQGSMLRRSRGAAD